MTLEDYIDDRKKEAQAEGRAEGLAEGRAEGLAEGRLEAVRELILRHAEKGLSVEEIAELDGLAAEEVMTIIGAAEHGHGS